MNIENEGEFKAKIDELGKIFDQIEEANENAKLLKMQLELYAKKNGVKSAKTELYSFKMTRDNPRLCRVPGVSEEEVVGLLEKSEVMREYVVASFDKESIKAYVKSDKNAAETLAKYGLFMTEPKPHAVIKPVK